MAILRPNADGTSNAKVGDIVVTGGGVFQKTVNGSIPVTNAKGENIFKDLVGVATTGSSALVNAAYNLLISKDSGVGNTGQGVYVPPASVVSNVDPNGIISVAGYDPGDYDTYSNTSSGGGISNILGYIMLGLVGIALLDRFMSKGGK